MRGQGHAIKQWGHFAHKKNPPKKHYKQTLSVYSSNMESVSLVLLMKSKHVKDFQPDESSKHPSQSETLAGVLGTAGCGVMRSWPQNSLHHCAQGLGGGVTLLSVYVDVTLSNSINLTLFLQPVQTQM